MKTDIFQVSRALDHERDRLSDQYQAAEKAGDIALSESLQRRFVEAARRCVAFQNMHMYDFSSALARSTGDYGFLERSLRQTLKDLQETFGENHRLVGLHRINMAKTYHETNDLVEAGEQFEQGILILRQTSPSEKEDLEGCIRGKKEPELQQMDPSRWQPGQSQ